MSWVPDDLTELTPQHVSALLITLIEFLKAGHHRVGVTILFHDSEGFKTVGNMPPELQILAFQMIAERLTTTGADSETDLGEDTTDATH